MKMFLAALSAAFLVTSAAAAEWKQKPIQCTETTEIFSRLIDPYKLKPMFAAVANIRTHTGELQPAVVMFFMNIDDGRFLMIETDKSDGYACILAIGDGVDFNITEQEIREFLLDDSGT